MMKVILKIDNIVDAMTRWCLISSLAIMLVLSLLNIVLRWMGTSYLWIEPLVRHLVFLSAFLGGSLAVSRKVHIKIDVLAPVTEKMSEQNKTKINFVISLASVVVLYYLMKASFSFQTMEQEFSSEVFLGINSGTLVGIIPWGFALILLRYVFQLFLVFNKEKP
jgi:TRAP-type C4-dicarboxylate transport system permease small subunit